MRTLLAALLLLTALVTVSADADPRVISNGSDWSAGVAYSYDGSGNVTQTGVDQYRYDRVGRIVRAEVNGFARTYTYDAFGNRLTCTQGASDCQYDVDIDSRTNRASLKNASGVETIQYDARGNLTVLGTHTYTYDAVNMMTRDAGTSGTREFLYTADDERLATVSNATNWTWTVRDTGGKVLREFTSTNGSLPGNANFVWTRDNIYRDGLLLASHQQVGGLPTRYQYHLDHLGTPRKVTDASDNVVGSHDYFAFGPETSGSTEEPNRSRLRYTGHERDTWGAESLDTLDYMHARHYSPVMGRFLSIDPSDDSTSPNRPQSWNRYGYARNNTLRFIDPDGRADRAVLHLKVTIFYDKNTVDVGTLRQTVESSVPRARNLFARAGIVLDINRVNLDMVTASGSDNFAVRENGVETPMEKFALRQSGYPILVSGGFGVTARTDKQKRYSLIGAKGDSRSLMDEIGHALGNNLPDDPLNLMNGLADLNLIAEENWVNRGHDMSQYLVNVFREHVEERDQSQ